MKETINIQDAYDATGFDFSGTKAFGSPKALVMTPIPAMPLARVMMFMLAR